MKKIIFYLSEDAVDFDMDAPTCYEKLYDKFVTGGGGNVGNKFFLTATKNYLKDEADFEHTLFYSNRKKNFCICDYSIDEINERFRAVVLPQANIFSATDMAIEHMKGFTEVINKLEIPVYVTGVGAQAQDYDSIYELYYSIRDVVTEFCKAVYRTGGEFSLRGFFTKEFFDMLGFKSAVVTGCPSIYQVGREFQICERKVSEIEFRPVINGYASLLRHNKIYDAFIKYNAVYLDQDEFIGLLYNSKMFEDLKLDDIELQKYVKKYSLNAMKIFAKDKVKLFYDIPIWQDYLKKNNFNFSFGKRIHGNIISIVTGIPAVVMVHDSRTRELAEYFSIPSVSNLNRYNNLYEMYLEADYSSFNKDFKEKYDNFNRFLIEHGLRKVNLSGQENDIKNLDKYTYPIKTNEVVFQNLEQRLEDKKYLKEEILYIGRCIKIAPAQIKKQLDKEYYRLKYFNESHKKKVQNKG